MSIKLGHIKFGILKSAQSVTTLEIEQFPKSMTILNAKRGKLLGRYLQLALDGFRLVEYLSERIPLLWTVSEDGGMFIAFEEFFTIHTGHFIPLGPKLRDLEKAEILRSKKPSESDRIIERSGHGALCLAREARIGGELVFEEDIREWSMNRHSGRFGYDAGVKAHHLDNAAKLMTQLTKVPIRADFSKPPL